MHTLACACLLLALVHASPLPGQTNHALAVEPARTALDHFQSVDQPQIEAAYQSLDLAREQLGRRLAASPATASEWKTYLDWDDQPQWLSDRDRAASNSAEEIAFWDGMHAKLVRNAPGLEQTELQAYRTQVERLLNLLSAAALTDPQAEYQEAAEQLEAVATHENAGLTEAETAQTRAALDWLASHGQSHPTADLLRAQFAYPNLRIRFSPESLFATSETVREQNPVSGCLGGYRFSGNSQTDLNFGVQSLLGSQQALLCLNFNGNYVASTRTNAQGTNISSNSQYPFQAAAAGQLSLAGLRVEPIAVTGQYRSQLTSIRTPHSRLRGRIERKRATAGYQSNFAEARRQTSNGLRAALDAAMRDEVAEFNAEFRARCLNPLLRLDLWPRNSNFTSDQTSVVANLTLAATSELAAPAMPRVDPLPGEEFAVFVHESAAQNYLRRLQPRGTVSIQRLMTQLGFANETPPARADELTIDLPHGPAIACFFREASVVFILHADQITYRGQPFAAADVRVVFELALDAENQWTLRRTESPAIGSSTLEATRRRLGIRDIALRRVLTKVFDREIPREIELSSLVDQLSGIDLEKSYQLQSTTSHEGWLRISGARR